MFKIRVLYLLQKENQGGKRSTPILSQAIREVIKFQEPPEKFFNTILQELGIKISKLDKTEIFKVSETVQVNNFDKTLKNIGKYIIDVIEERLDEIRLQNPP